MMAEGVPKIRIKSISSSCAAGKESHLHPNSVILDVSEKSLISSIFKRGDSSDLCPRNDGQGKLIKILGHSP